MNIVERANHIKNSSIELRQILDENRAKLKATKEIMILTKVLLKYR